MSPPPKLFEMVTSSEVLCIKILTHLQVFGQKFTLIHRVLASKTRPIWLRTHNMTQYGSVPGAWSKLSQEKPITGARFLKSETQILFFCILQLCFTHNMGKSTHKWGQELINFTYKRGCTCIYGFTGSPPPPPAIIQGPKIKELLYCPDNIASAS